MADDCVAEYNDTIHSSTGFSPRYLLNGISAPLSSFSSDNKVNIKKLETDRIKAFENSSKVHNYNKKKYDKSKGNKLQYWRSCSCQSWKYFE